MKMKSGGLALKMTVMILGGTALVFALVLTKAYMDSRDLILDQAQEGAIHLAQSVAGKIDTEFRSIAAATQALSNHLEFSTWDGQILDRLLMTQVARNPEIIGSTVSFEPEAYRPGVKMYAPYFYKEKNSVRYAQLAMESNPYFQQDWYHLPRYLSRPIWTEPYFDELGAGILMCTYSVPLFFKGEQSQADLSQVDRVRKDRIRGIVTSDISLEWMTDLLVRVRVGVTGYAFLISETGRFIAHPRTALVMRESMFSLAEETNQPQLRALGRAMIQEKSGFRRIESDLSQVPAYVAFARVPSAGWSVGVVYPEAELLADLRRFNIRSALMAWVGVGLLFLVIMFLSRSITKPLTKMAEAAGQMAGGALDIDLTGIKRRDEIGELARSFTTMSHDLKKYIHDLTVTTAAKERIESELNIASEIQASILPSIFPPFPERDEFDLFAFMRPAREIGGDFYDFFFLDDDHLAVIIADVSGKGVPAALFMMVSRTLLKTLVAQGLTPAQALAEGNDLLCQNNDTGMFVTVFLAFYEVSTGKLTVANGGHNPPIIYGPNSPPREMVLKKGVVLGFRPELRYDESEDWLDVGQALVLYTDGVTEASDPDGGLWGESRFFAALTRNLDLAPRDLCSVVAAELDEFQQGEQFDDITMLVLRRQR